MRSYFLFYKTTKEGLKKGLLSIKCLPYKHEDLTSEPTNPCKVGMRAGKVAQWLEALAEDPCSVPAPTKPFTTIGNLSSRGPVAFFSPLQVPDTDALHIHVCR